MSNQTDKTPAKTSQPKITSQVLAQIDSMRCKGSIELPSDYAVGNALNAAWLVLQTIENKDHKPLFKNGQLTGIVTVTSVVNALHDMVIQALSVAKKQGYFIVRGELLTFQRSYFGDQALAERVRPGIAIYSDVIYKGEKFSTAKLRSKSGFVTVVATHEQPFPRPSTEIVGAYAGAIDTETGEDLGIQLMDMAQIKQSWKKSKTVGPTSFHTEQPDIACRRTVLRRWCTPIINASDDALLLASVQRQDMDVTLALANEEAAVHGNGEVLALDAPVIEAPAQVAVPEAVLVGGDAGDYEGSEPPELEEF